MCNCGKKRSELTQQSNANKSANIIQQRPTIIQKKEPVLFEYTGKSALSVIGNITRRNYRFHFPGDKQYIESGDAAAMMAVPVLKRII